MRVSTPPALLIALALLLPGVASGQIRLDGFFDKQGGQVVIDQAGFDALAGDITHLIGPKMLGPAKSSGGLGFEFGLDIAVGTLSETAHWEKAIGSGESTATALQLQARKGLPYGFELGGVVSHLVDTDLWGVGMDLKYAFLEGYRFLPDVALRASVATTLGSRDMSLLVVGGDLTISKNFAIAGLVTMAPYAGYSFLYGRAASYIVAFFPPGQPQPERAALARKNLLLHRGFIGFKLVYAHATLAFEAMIAGDVNIFTTRIGADF